MIASDNACLSLAIAPIVDAQVDRATTTTSPVAVSRELHGRRGHAASTDAISRYLAAAIADSTRRAYGSDVRAFLAWGGSLPAAPEIVAAYLATHAPFLSPVTLIRRLVAIGRAHALVGQPNPCRSELVRATLRGIRRLHGRPQRQVLPVLPNDVLATLADAKGAKGLRDRALLLVGFAGAFRRSELVALRCEDVAFVNEGMLLTLRRSKTDPFGNARRIAIPHARAGACPVQALQAWLAHAQIDAGPLFRTVSKGGHVGTRMLSAQTVALLVKEYARRAGLDAAHYSGHSLRAGLITSAAQAGVPAWKIRGQSGHRSEATMNRYIRDAALFKVNAAGEVL